MTWRGDYTEDYATLNFKFTTSVNGVPIVLAGTPVIAVYKGSATGTEKTSAESYITLTVDFDSVVGVNHVLIDLSGDAFFAIANDYQVVITTGTVDGKSVVGHVVGEFSIENRFGVAVVNDWTDGGRLDLIIDAILADTGELQADDVPGLIAALNDITAASVWAVDATGEQTGGTFGQAIGDPGANTETMYDAVINDAAGTNIAADIIAVKTVVDDTKDATIAASGVVETSGSNSSTQVQTDLAEASDDHYDVMTILFTSGAEAGQSRLITGYTGSSGTVSWNAALIGTPADDVTFVILAAGTTADAVWDEILTGASHNIPTSAGKRLRQIEEAFVHASGTIAAVSGGHQVTLDGGAVGSANYYVGDRLQITEGTGLGQSRIIIKYTAGKVITLDSDWITNPDTNSLYDVVAADVHVAVSDADLAEGFVVTATSTTTITLDDTTAVATTDYYVGDLIIFTHGTGAGQSREITAYTSGRVVTMSPALATAVSTDTVWHIQAAPSIAEIADEIWDEALSGHTTAGTSGKLIGDMTYTKANELDVNTKSINDAEVVGDGNSTPWDGA